MEASGADEPATGKRADSSGARGASPSVTTDNCDATKHKYYEWHNRHGSLNETASGMHKVFNRRTHYWDAQHWQADNTKQPYLSAYVDQLDAVVPDVLKSVRKAQQKGCNFQLVCQAGSARGEHTEPVRTRHLCWRNTTRLHIMSCNEH